MDRRPAQLSGGQRQRVAIGRAIEREPEVFLFDGSLANVDAELRVQMRSELAALHVRLGATMAGLNLLAAIIIYWNTEHLGLAVTQRKHDGSDCPDELLAHISPLGWARILLTGENRWPKQ